MAAQQKDERLILFVFSDGLPAQVINALQPIHQKYLKTVVEEVERAGVELIGFGIQTESVKMYYKNHFILQNIRHLIGTELGVLSDILIGTRKERIRRSRKIR